MEATSEDETVEIFTKTIKVINRNTISRISFVTKYNEWSKRFETTFNSLTKTKKNFWLSVSPNRYLQFCITSIITLFFLESIRCKNTTCCLTGFAFMSFLMTWTFLVALMGNLSKHDGSINSVIIYVGSLTNLCQIMTNKLNRTRQLMKIIAGPNFLHTVPDCYKFPDKLHFNILLHSWLRLCFSWMDVWGIIFGVQISVILCVFEFHEYPQLLQCLSGLLIIVGIFTQNKKLRRCRLEMQQTRKILKSITLEYFQWFENKCALRALIMKSGYFDLQMEDIFHHRFCIFGKDSVQSKLMYSLIAVGMAYGLQYETRETFLTDAVRFVLFNKRPKQSSSSHQNIQNKELKIPHDNFKKESKSCFDYLNTFTNWLTSQKLTSSIPSEVPKSEKNASNKEMVKSPNHAMEFKEQIEENAQEEEQDLEINQSKQISNTVHVVTKDYFLQSETLKQAELTISNDNSENNERIKTDNLSNVTKLDEITQKSTLEPTTQLINIEQLEQESKVFAEQSRPLHVNLEQYSEEFVNNDTKMENKCIVINRAVESDLSVRSQEATNTQILKTVSEVCEQEKFVDTEKLNDNVSCDILPSSFIAANVPLNEFERLTKNSNEKENTRECCHFEWNRQETTKIESANSKMNDIMGNSECCKVGNQYQMSEEFINYDGNKPDILLLNDTVEPEKNCQFIWNSFQNLASNTEVDSKVNNEDNIINSMNLSNKDSTESYASPSSPAIFERVNECGIIEVSTNQNVNSDHFRRIQVSENENVSRNKNSPILYTHYAECNDKAVSTDGISWSLESEINCDSNSNRKSIKNSQIEEICVENNEELIDKLKNEEKTTSFRNSGLKTSGESSQYSTNQNKMNFQNAKDRRKYTRLENFKCYIKRTPRKGNHKYTFDGQKNTEKVFDNCDDPQVQTTEKNAYEMLVESSFEFSIKNPIQNNEKIHPITDFKNQRQKNNEYFTGCSSFSSGVFYTQQSNSFSVQSNVDNQALDSQDPTDGEESSTPSEHSPKPQKRNFRWISDEAVILDPQNDPNINTENLLDDSFVDEESLQPSVSITEPITYSLRCGNMNLEFTEKSPNVSLRFICESNEDVVVHKTPKRIISKTISDEEELTYPGNSLHEESYDSDSSLESSTVESSSETTMDRHIPDSDQSSLTADEHIGEIPFNGHSHIDKVPLTGLGPIEEIPTTFRYAAPVDGNVNQDLHFETDNVKLNFVPTPNSWTLEVDYRQSHDFNRFIFKSNDKKLKLKIKK